MFSSSSFHHFLDSTSSFLLSLDTDSCSFVFLPLRILSAFLRLRSPVFDRLLPSSLSLSNQLRLGFQQATSHPQGTIQQDHQVRRKGRQARSSHRIQEDQPSFVGRSGSYVSLLVCLASFVLRLGRDFHGIFIAERSGGREDRTVEKIVTVCTRRQGRDVSETRDEGIGGRGSSRTRRDCCLAKAQLASMRI